MKLTFINRLKLCVEILTIKSGHNHHAQEKQLPVFIRGYDAGLADGKLEMDDYSYLKSEIMERDSKILHYRKQLGTNARDLREQAQAAIAERDKLRSEVNPIRKSLNSLTAERGKWLRLMKKKGIDTKHL